jgi:uncharacterized protein (DUF3820 family)
MKMPWGKYKGEEIESLPSSYLRWLAETISENSDCNRIVCLAADEEYQFREKFNGHFE